MDPARVRPVDVPELRGDRSRLRAATGWAPEIPLDDTLAAVLDYWRDPGHGPSRAGLEGAGSGRPLAWRWVGRRAGARHP